MAPELKGSRCRLRTERARLWQGEPVVHAGGRCRVEVRQDGPNRTALVPFGSFHGIGDARAPRWGSTMSLSLVQSRSLVGLQAAAVTVEVHLANGLPSFTLVGLADTEVKEARVWPKIARAQRPQPYQYRSGTARAATPSFCRARPVRRDFFVPSAKKCRRST